MAVKLRLKRTGAKNAPSYRIVAADMRAARDGKAIDTLGFYDPIRKQEKIDLEKVSYWKGCGALVSPTVESIAKRAEDGISLADFKAKKAKKPSKKAIAKMEAEKAAAAEAAAEATEAAE